MMGEPSSPEVLDVALGALARTARLLVCCDFDGTISAIADDPAAARPVDGAVAALDSLAGLPQTWAAVVSGRALIDLSRLAGMPDGVHLVGSHGTEFEVGSIVAVSPPDTALLETIVALCRAVAHDVPGVIVEEKPASVAVHVRLSSPSDADRVLSVVRAGPGSLAGVHVIEGKAVVELAVFPGQKGDGVLALQERWNTTRTLFIGDDVTDESAFAALGPNDVSIKVGDGVSSAAWRVEDPDAVVDVLERLGVLRAAALT